MRIWKLKFIAAVMYTALTNGYKAAKNSSVQVQ